MPTNRKTVFANDEIYHIFNRGIDRRTTFIDKRTFARAVETMAFYQYADLPMRFSKFSVLEKEKRLRVLRKIQDSKKAVKIIAYCFMPNHFHFLLKQKEDKGISRFAANFTNSYTKYFNVKNKRVGPLFQGLFKAVHIETDEQLIHVSRYIHLNPVSAYIIEPEELETYKWSSYPEYIGADVNNISDSSIVIKQFSSTHKYKEFVLDRVDYARKLESIKHLLFE